MAGSLPTDYLDPLNWGTGTAETTATLGTDRLDVRVPPSAYHSSHLQLARMRSLLQSMSEYSKGGARLRVIPQAGNPLAGGSESGFYIDSAGTAYRVFNGTPLALAGGGGGMVIGNAITGATQGSILFAGVGGALQQDNANLFYDDTLNNVGIGTATPSTFRLEVAGNVGPEADNTRSLGAFNKRWSSLHLGPGSLVIHNDATDTAKTTLEYSGGSPRLNTSSATDVLGLATGGTSRATFTSTEAKLIQSATEFLSVTNAPIVGDRALRISSKTTGFSANTFDMFHTNAANPNAFLFTGYNTASVGPLFVVDYSTTGGPPGDAFQVQYAGAPLFTVNGAFTRIDSGILQSNFIEDDSSTASIALGGTELAFATGGTAAVTIDSSQMVGFGTASPLRRIHAVASDDTCQLRSDHYGSASGGGIISVRGRGTPSVPTAAQTGDTLGLWATFGVYSGGTVGSNVGQALFAAAENFTAGAQGTYWQLETTPIGSTTRAIRVLVTGTGLTGLGTITPQNRLDVFGALAVGSYAGVNTAPTNGAIISGSVGIGTALPSSLFHISSDTGAGNMADLYTATAAASSVFLGRRARGTAAAPTAVLANDLLGAWATRGYHSGGAFATSHNVQVLGWAAENFTASAQGTYLTIHTTATGATVSSERVRVDSAGNMGLGTSSPSTLLHVSGSSATSTLDSYVAGVAGANVNLRKARGTSGAPTQALSGDTLGAFLFNGYHSGAAFSTTNPAAIFATAAENFTATAQGTNIVLGTTPIGTAARVERVRVIDTGHIGLGTSTPFSLLNLSSDGATAWWLTTDVYVSTASGSGLVGRKARGTSGAPTQALADDALVFVIGRGYQSGGAFSTVNNVQISGHAAESFTATAQGTYITLRTTPTGSTTLAERVRIDPSGGVGVGTLASNDAAAILQADSTTKGFLPPRMTTAQRDAIATPPAGLLIYNTTTNKLNVYTTAWEAVTSA